MGNFLRAGALVTSLALIPSVAFGQAQTQPVVINGGGGASAITTCPVGSGAAIACPMPVTVTSGGGTQDVNLIQTGGVTQLRGAGAVSTGSERVAVGQDVTTIAGSAPGTAGTASANVVTVQGIASGTVVPVSGTVTANNPIGITPTDRTVTSATGSSQTVMPSNSSRHSLIIQNTGNANCGINPTGGTAVIGGAGTLTLLPAGSYQPRIPTLSAVTAICTAAQPLYAEEN